MLRRLVTVLALTACASTLASCAGARGTWPAAAAPQVRTARVAPQAYQQNDGAQFVEYPADCSAPLGPVAEGADGATIWFLAPKSCKNGAPAQVGSVTVAGGNVSEYMLPKDTMPTALAPNAGYVWVAVKGKVKGGAHTLYRYVAGGPSGSYALPDDLSVTAMTTGPDGNVWFVGTYVSNGKTLAGTGYATPAGATTIFQVTGKATPKLTALAAGSDGNIWLADEQNGAVLKVVPATGATTAYAVGGHPFSITNSNNELVYSDEKTAQLSVLTTHGVASVYPAPKGEFPGIVARKNDGTVIYVDTAGGAQALGTFDTASGSYAAEAQAPSAGIGALVNGPDGNMWFSDAHGHVGAYLKFVLATTPNSLVLGTSTCTATFTVAESNYTGTFSVSSNPAIATVSPASGTSATTFTVTDVAPGQESIGVEDSMQNAVAIPLTVTGACGSDQYYVFYSGAEQPFAVPSGVRSLRVDAYGGAASDSNGGFVEATIPVTPAQSLAVFVGGNAAQGGFNGGGAAGQAGGIDSSAGGVGGGASDVRQGGSALSDRVIVAGGGGGAGDYAGGAGGGSTGAPGQDEPYQQYGQGGGGGSQTSGGAGGAGGISGCADGSPGSNGTLGAGGAGGQGAPYGQLLCYPADGGGGGGGGYYGGGGGGGGTTTYGSGGQSAGGGGGSSYIEPSATHVTNTQGGSSGGLVIFSWGDGSRARPVPWIRPSLTRR
jgi:streptogramin lyase